MNTPDQRVVGHRVIRKDSAIKVTGEAIYAGDIKMPGMLYGKALRSQYPHAKILSIDTSAAEAIEGVHCVMTARDLPGINRFGLAILDQPVLAEDKVRMMGDSVAFVAAESEELCEDAIRAIRVEYEPLRGLHRGRCAEGWRTARPRGRARQHSAAYYGPQGRYDRHLGKMCVYR